MQTNNGHSLSYKPTSLPYDLEVTHYSHRLCTFPHNTKYCLDGIAFSWWIAKDSEEVTVISIGLPYLQFSNHWDCITEPRDKLCKWAPAPHDSRKAQMTIIWCTHPSPTPERSEHVSEQTHLSGGAVLSTPWRSLWLSRQPGSSTQHRATASREEGTGAANCFLLLTNPDK